MSDLYSQLKSILNSGGNNNQNEAQQQQQQRQAPQMPLEQQHLRIQQQQQQQQQPHYSTIRASSTSPYHQFEQEQQQQEHDLINSLSSIPLPSFSQLPNKQDMSNENQQHHQQQQQQQTRSPFHHLQQSNNQQQQYHQQQHHQHQQQHQQQQHHHQGPSSSSIGNNPTDNQPSVEPKKQPNRTREEIEFPAQFNYMPGTASLIEDIDKQLMVILRDGRTLIGYLRSIDQYANLLLSSTIERIHVGTKYGDIPRGIYMIRGENVVLLGEIDFNIPLKVSMTKVSVEEILELQRVEQKKQEEEEKTKKKALLERCLIPHTDGILDEYY